MIDPEAAAMGGRLVRQFEGCVLKPYQDAGGVWTIGYGSYVPHFACLEAAYEILATGIGT